MIIKNDKRSYKPLEHGDGVEERKGYRMGTGEKMEEEERRGKGRVEVRLELGRHECGRLSLYGACADRSRDLPYRSNEAHRPDKQQLWTS